MPTQICELYRPPDATRAKPSCEAAEILTELFHLLSSGVVSARAPGALKSTLEKMSRMGG